MNWAEECSFEGQSAGEEGSFHWTNGRKGSSDYNSNIEESQRFLNDTETGSLWDTAITGCSALEPAKSPSPTGTWTMRDRPTHLTDSDLALSQEIFIRRCQGQDKVDFRDLLTPEMQLEAQRLLNAKLMPRSRADSWIDENSWNWYNNYNPEHLETFGHTDILLYRMNPQ